MTAQAWITPRSLLTTRVARASDSTSSAMIKSGRFESLSPSSMGRSFWIELILASWMRISGFSKTTSMLAVSVTKFGDR